jgi:hypothetical protein
MGVAQNEARISRTLKRISMQIIVDGREMQPPEPLEKTLSALDELGPGDEVVLWVRCQPQPLFNVLKRNGYQWTASDGPDGSFEYRISKAA